MNIVVPSMQDIMALEKRIEALEALTKKGGGRSLLMNTEELSEYTGLAPNTIRQYVFEGKLPRVKIGRNNFFDKREIDKALFSKP